MLKDFHQRTVGHAMAVSVALEDRDGATSWHCGRVFSLALELGRRCGLSERELRQLGIAAALHDVGKIGIPDSVLKKSGSFNDDDRAVMKAHTLKGQRIIAATPVEDADAIGWAVRHHHERYDGSGYPDGLAGEAIPILARIVAIADAYDAMARMRRHYGPSRAHRDILDVLSDERGRQHDPWLYANFIRVLDSSVLRARE